RGAARSPRLPPVTAAGRLAAPLTVTQAMVWETQRNIPGYSRFNVSAARRLDHALDPQTLVDALDDVSARHPVLTSVVLDDPDLPPSMVPSGRCLDIDFIDLTHLSIDDAEATARDLGQHLRRQPFDLAVDLPVRVWLVRMTGGG